VKQALIAALLTAAIFALVTLIILAAQRGA
jgi:hypothetical protein